MNDISQLATNAKTDKALLLPLWEAVERLVRFWAIRYHHIGETRLYDTDDLMQAGFLALVDAVRGYDADTGTEFTTYLHFHVQTQFADVAGRRGTKRRPELNAASLDEPVDADEGTATRADLLPDPGAQAAFTKAEDDLYTAQLHDALEGCMTTLDEREADLLRVRYYDGQSVPAVAEAWRESPQRIRQLEVCAIRAMRRPANRGRLKEYRENIISRSLRFSSLGSWRDNGYSGPEWAAEQLSGDVTVT